MLRKKLKKERFYIQKENPLIMIVNLTGVVLKKNLKKKDGIK